MAENYMIRNENVGRFQGTVQSVQGTDAIGLWILGSSSAKGVEHDARRCCRRLVV